MQVSNALHECRARAVKYLASQALETKDGSFWRHSPAHDPDTHSSLLLCGTWAGAHASVLLGQDASFDVDRRRRIGAAINSFQQADGSFLMKGSKQPGSDAELEYQTLQCTNYALGGLHALAQAPRVGLSFMQSLMARRHLLAWLDKRDMRSPWAEGNNVVNVASFYAILSEEGDSEAESRLRDVADWLDRTQQARNTGFWHEGEMTKKGSLIIAMAGAAHYLHVYYYLNRDVPNPEAIIDSCLRLGYLGVQSACVDLDMVDILTNLRRYSYRIAEINRILRRYLVELLDVQRSDGGFCDNYVTRHLYYGQTTPAGISVTWTTWFRLAAIGMIVCALFPEQQSRWHFRNTLGSGYWNREFSNTVSKPIPAEISGSVPDLTRIWWATKRKQRFVRQRLTSSLRAQLVQAK
ncbi:MAG TPA: hypothetical protein VLB68_07645 [Pyrinomonadaceae bacterium]|nr:hypothetical protein [Pyrinomonadaceae bacterium]